MAIDDGDVQAMFEYAKILKPKYAPEYYEMAAKEGHVEVMVKFAEFLQDDDAESALMWYERAAEKGNL